MYVFINVSDEIEDVRFFPSNALKEGFPNLLVIKPGNLCCKTDSTTKYF